MIKPIIILSFFILPITVFAQKKNSIWEQRQKRKGYRGDTWTISSRLAFKVTPTSMLDIYGALLPLGLEYYFGERYGMSADVGLPLYYVLNNYRNDPQKTVNSDYKLRADIRQYFRLRARTRLYYGAEIFFRRQEMSLSGSYLHFIDGNCYDYSRINATKSIYGTGVLLGISGKLSEHFLVGGHIGLGLRMIRMKSDLDTRNLVPRQEKSFVSWIPPNGDRVGDKDINGYIPFAIKISYLF